LLFAPLTLGDVIEFRKDRPNLAVRTSDRPVVPFTRAHLTAPCDVLVDDVCPAISLKQLFNSVFNLVAVAVSDD